MKMMVLNAGSGSQKCSLFELPASSLSGEPLEPIWEATFDSTAPGQPEGKLVIRASRHGEDIEAGSIDERATTTERTDYLLRLLWEGPAKITSRASEIDIIGHRVVHGGAEFREAVRVTADVEASIERFAAFAPLHNTSDLIGIRVARKLFGEDKPQVAVFDTAFHRTIVDAVATYAGPRAWIDQGIRRYGFHGTSFRYASGRAAQLLGRIDDPQLRLILCHLGGGCSLCATVGGYSIDTTMGFTPLDGIAMCTRSGAIDPGILIYLLRQGASADELENLLNKESGLKGLSALSGDTRVLRPAAASGDARARLALDVFIHRLQSGIGEMLASLGNAPHALIFTDAIGEDEPSIRAAACAPFAFLGLGLDTQKNDVSPLDSDLATQTSAIRVLLIKSREDWQVAREGHALWSLAGRTSQGLNP